MNDDDRITAIEKRLDAASALCIQAADKIADTLRYGGELNSGPALIGILRQLADRLGGTTP